MRKRSESIQLSLDTSRTVARKAGPAKPSRAQISAALTESGHVGFRWMRAGAPGSGAWIVEDNGKRLPVKERIKIYREMGKTPVFGTAMFIFRLLLSQVDYKVQPRENSKDAQRVKLAEFAEECLQDMSVPMEAGAWEQWSCLQYGHAECEVVFKERNGQDPGTYVDKLGFRRPIPASAFDDGKIGIDRLAFRAQATIDRWILNENGGVEGIIQLDPNTGQERAAIPSWKLARFVFGSSGNPHGESIFDSCLTVYPLWKRIQEAEAVGATRRLQGTPMAYAPDGWMDPKAKTEQKAALAALDKALEKLTLTNDSRLVVPSIFDAEGNRLLEISLLSLEGTAGIDTSAILDRIEQRMSSALMVSLMLLGQGKSGTQALAKEQNKLLLDCLNALGHFRARAITEVLRNLIRLNGWPECDAPEYVAQSLKSIPDFLELCEGIAKLSPSGFMVGPDSVLSAEIRSRAGVAPPAEGEGDSFKPQPLDPIAADPNDDPNADPDNPSDPGDDPEAQPPAPKPKPKPKPAVEE
jgi:hypothetical protein